MKDTSQAHLVPVTVQGRLGRALGTKSCCEARVPQRPLRAKTRSARTHEARGGNPSPTPRGRERRSGKGTPRAPSAKPQRAVQSFPPPGARSLAGCPLATMTCLAQPSGHLVLPGPLERRGRVGGSASRLCIPLSTRGSLDLLLGPWENEADTRTLFCLLARYGLPHLPKVIYRASSLTLSQGWPAPSLSTSWWSTSSPSASSAEAP